MAEVGRGPRSPRWRRRGALAAVLIVPALLAGGPSEGAPAAPAEEPAPPKLAESVKVEVVASEGVMDDLRGGRLIVVVRNSSPAPVDVTALEGDVDDAYGQVDLTVEPADRCARADSDSAFPCTIAGNEQALFPVDVEVTELARTGKATVAFDVGLEQAGVTGNAIATAPVSLGVFGESELLPILQVPSILLLPGALILVALTALWRLGVRPLKRDEEFPLAASGAEFWLVAIVVSAAIALLWRTVFGKNLLAGYGYRDIAGVLIAALVVVAAVATILGALRASQSKKAKAAKALQVAEGDDAATALKKLSQRDEKARLRAPVMSRDTIQRVVYERGEGDSMVVGMPLRVTLSIDADDAVKVEDEVQDLGAKGRLAPIARYLLARVEAGAAEVAWEGGKAPFEAVRADYKPAGDDKDLVEWEQGEVRPPEREKAHPLGAPSSQTISPRSRGEPLTGDPSEGSQDTSR